MKKKRYVEVGITKLDEKTIEYTISSPHFPLIRGLENPSEEYLNSVIEFHKKAEAKGKVKKLKKIPVIYKRY